MCQQNTHLNVHARTSKPQEGFTCKDSHAKCFKTTNSSDVSRWSFESVFPSFSGLFLLLRKFRNFYTRIKRKFYWNIYIHTKWRSVKELRKNTHFCTFERRFSYAFDWKHDERHLPEQFAWRVEWREHGDTKIEVIECEFPICIYLICDTASSESGTRNLLGACRHKVVVSAFLGIRRFPTLLEDFPNTIFSKFFSSSKILLLESPLNFHAS